MEENEIFSELNPSGPRSVAGYVEILSFVLPLGLQQSPEFQSWQFLGRVYGVLWGSFRVVLWAEEREAALGKNAG